jgi:hypothetical protein
MNLAGHRVRNLALAGFLSVLISSNASANFTCSGQVAYLGMNAEGVVTVSVGFGVWYICNQSSAYTVNGLTYTPEGCRAWYASLVAAKTSGQAVRFFFSSPAESSNGPECNAVGNWAWPSPGPYHFNLM